MARQRKPKASSAKEPQARRSLEESLASLRGDGDGHGPRVEPDGKSWLPDHHAGVERPEEQTAEFADITFFRTGWQGADLANLTLPRRFINRSSFTKVSFVNTDLSQSFMCWNDFIGCDFTDADLTCCDMRSSNFRKCKFVRCRLVCADLQRSAFDGCDFTGADLRGARVDDQTTDTLESNDEQTGWLEYTDAPDGVGPMPKGG